jgi:hypothetical protein
VSSNLIDHDVIPAKLTDKYWRVHANERGMNEPELFVPHYGSADVHPAGFFCERRDTVKRRSSCCP